MATNQKEKSEDTIGIPSFYSNMVRVVVTPYDVRLDFFHRKSLPDEKEQPQVSVYMSMEHAKSMVLIINERLEVFEKDFGVKVIDPLPMLREKDKLAQKKRSKPSGQKPRKK